MHVAIDETRPATPPRQIISNARGGFPQLEMVSLPSPKSPKSPKSPRRMRTVSGSAAPQRAVTRSDSQPINQVMRNIVEKLDTVRPALLLTMHLLSCSMVMYT